ncbi:MAG: hypothetical protein OXN89_13480 [Bryobacterales bacterium]|nr:hypothetical protein [Bryobacterales bacterium]
MKRLNEFVREETAEEWLRELYKVVAMRRSTMFRLITESVRLVLFGNGGGAALIIGFMSASNVDQTPTYHWMALITLLVFGVGTLAAALAMILVAVVTIKEAHSAESALKRFADGEFDRDNVMFVVEQATFRFADYATFAGLFSTAAFGAGGIGALTLLMLYF